MHPQSGGRILLVLGQADAKQARCEANLYVPAEQWSGAAVVDCERGEVHFEGLEAAPEWLCTLTRTVLRTTWRNSPQEGWPRRIQRWRPGPERTA